MTVYKYIKVNVKLSQFVAVLIQHDHSDVSRSVENRHARNSVLHIPSIQLFKSNLFTAVHNFSLHYFIYLFCFKKLVEVHFLLPNHQCQNVAKKTKCLHKVIQEKKYLMMV